MNYYVLNDLFNLLRNHIYQSLLISSILIKYELLCIQWFLLTITSLVVQTCTDLPLCIGPRQTLQRFYWSSILARVLWDGWAISVQLLPRVIIHMYPGWFPDTLPSPNHSGVAVLSSISSCAPRSTFTFTVRVLCITHVSYTQIHKSPFLHVPAPTPHIHNGKLCIS